MSSDGKKTLSSGALALINNQVDQASGTIQMKGSFANQDNALWPGLSVSTRLLIRTVKDGTIVPEPAIQHGPDGLFVYVVGQDNKAKKQAVKVAEQTLAEALVTDGVSPGQKVVVAGQSRVQDGVLLKPTDKQAAPPPTQPSVAQAPATPPEPKPPQQKP